MSRNSYSDCRSRRRKYVIRTTAHLTSSGIIDVIRLLSNIHLVSRGVLIAGPGKIVVLLSCRRSRGQDVTKTIFFLLSYEID